MQPEISCLCTTYNRYPKLGWLLEESVESFLRQTHGNAELLILNDTPRQTLLLDHPCVRIINYPARFKTLTAKLQSGIEAARGSILCRWDDDDIHLPHRLKYSRKKLGDALEWRPGNYFWMPPEETIEVHHPGNTHIMSLWRREVLDRIGGYPTGVSGNEDQLFNERLLAYEINRYRPEIIPTREVFYFYRWGTGSAHLSGKADYGSSNPHQSHYDEIGRRSIATGEYRINPHWRYDYVAQARQVNKIQGK